MPRRTGILAAIVIMLALGVGGCAPGRGTAAPSDLPSPAASATPAPPSASPATTPTAEPVDTMVVEAWFLIGEKLAVVHREVPRSVGVLRAALEQLLAGPTPADTNHGIITAVPAGTELLGVTVAGDTATVDLSSRFESGGGSLSMMARMAQLVFTATQFPNVERVELWLDGKPVEWIGGEGLIVVPPQTRRDYDGMSGAIVVDGPGVGDEVSSPLRVTGEANVFEAVVDLELRDGAGNVILHTTTMATAGTGTWGTYDVTLRFTAPPGPLELEVFATSPKDGSRIEQVVYPLQGRG